MDRHIDVRPTVTTGTASIRGTELEVSTEAIVHNVRALAARATPDVLAVVKANAYGVGAGIVAPALVDAGVRELAVVTVEEAVALRASGLKVPILVLGGATWLRAPELLVELSLTPLISSVDELTLLDVAVTRRGATLDVCLALDTGMAREGFFVSREDPEGDARRVVDALARTPALCATGAMTHFAHADLSSDETTRDQVRRFARALATLLDGGVPIASVHVANSAAALTLGARPFELDEARFASLRAPIRPGIALLGVSPFSDGRHDALLVPAFRWRAPIVVRKRVPPGTHVSYGGTFTTTRPTELAVLGVGYADGYPRALSGRGIVGLAGMHAPILGRVCMDLVVVDVTDVVTRLGEGAARLGARATLLGGQGDDALSTWDVAARADTIAYEITNRISARVPRVAVRRFDDDARAA